MYLCRVKILLLCKKYPWPLKDGEVIAIHHMILGFTNHGHQVTVLAFNTTKHFTNTAELPETERERASYIEVPIDTSLKVTDAVVNLFEAVPYHIRRFTSSAFKNQLIALLTQESFDLIQLEGIHLCPYLDTIREYSNAPVTLRAHNVESLIWDRLAREEQSTLKSLYLKMQAKRLAAYEKGMVNKVDAVIPISEVDQMKLSAWGLKVPIFTCPTGIDLHRYEPYLKSTVNLKAVGFIGSLDWMPNQNGIRWFVEKCWPGIVAEHKDAMLYIAGRNMPGEMRELEQVTGVKVLGEVDDALRFMMQCGIIIVPLFSGSGMRIKIIEAMALGKPVVTTPVGLEGIDAREGEDCLVADTAERFTEAVISLLEHSDRQLEVSRNARRFIENHYDNDTFTGELIRFYQTQFRLW